jgi:hypothetical protein
MDLRCRQHLSQGEPHESSRTSMANQIRRRTARPSRPRSRLRKPGNRDSEDAGSVGPAPNGFIRLVGSPKHSELRFPAFENYDYYINTTIVQRAQDFI